MPPTPPAWKIMEAGVNKKDRGVLKSIAGVVCGPVGVSRTAPNTRGTI